jgi:hypothetical protein
LLHCDTNSRTAFIWPYVPVMALSKPPGFFCNGKQRSEYCGETMIVTLEPDTSHCVETVAKKEYERVLNLLINGNQPDSQLEDRLELLRLFLESADFGKLRSRCDDFLLHGRRIVVRLTSTTEALEYEIEINEVS